MNNIKWSRKPFTEIFDIQGGTQPPKSEFKSTSGKGYVRLLQIRDFGERPVPTFIPDTKTIKKCNEDDILIGRYGASVGRICTGMNGAYNVALAKVIIPDFIDRKYLKYWLTSELFQAPLRLVQRTAQNGFNKEDLSKIEFSFPDSLEAQKNVSKKIDSLFAEIDKGVNELENAKAKLELYRQSALNAAIQGKLVPQDPKDEAASKFLEKIRTEKEKLIVSGKLKKEKLMPPIDLDDIPFDLPKGWEWARLRDLVCTISDGDHSAPPKAAIGIPFIVISDMKNDKLNLNTQRWVPQDYYDKLSKERKASLGDILYSVTGSYGITKKVDTESPFCFQRHVALIKPIPLFPAEFIEFFLKSPFSLLQATECATGTAQLTVPIMGLREMLVAVPPHREILRICLELRELLSTASQNLTIIESQLANANVLKQSILKKAFDGELV